MAKTKKEKWSLRQDFRKRWQLYLMLLLPVLYILIFCYVPMGGIIISFKDYSFRKGILGSPWVGLKYFKQFFGSPDIGMLLKKHSDIGASEKLFEIFQSHPRAPKNSLPEGVILKGNYNTSHRYITEYQDVQNRKQQHKIQLPSFSEILSQAPFFFLRLSHLLPSLLIRCSRFVNLIT